MNPAGGAARWKEARRTPGFRFIGVDRKGIVVASSGMRHVIGATSQCAFVAKIHDVKDQRCMNRNSGMQTARRLPRSIADATHELAGYTSGFQRKTSTITCHCVALTQQTGHSNLQAFHGRIDIPRGAACSGFFTQHVPGFYRLTQFHFDAFITNPSVNRKSELHDWGNT